MASIHRRETGLRWAGGVLAAGALALAGPAAMAAAAPNAAGQLDSAPPPMHGAPCVAVAGTYRCELTSGSLEKLGGVPTPPLLGAAKALFPASCGLVCTGAQGSVGAQGADGQAGSSPKGADGNTGTNNQGPQGSSGQPGGPPMS